METKLKGNLMLLVAALIWGTSFVAQSEGMEYVEPFTYGGIRTIIGGIVLLPLIVFMRKNRKFSSENKPPISIKSTAIGGVICGCVLFVASSLQQIGMTETSAGKAGFITALYIVIVPVFELILYHRTKLKVWICVVIAGIGFWLLCIKDGFRIETGDLIILCCALFFAVHIMVIDRFSDDAIDPVLLSCIQFFTAGTLMIVCMFIFESPSLDAIWQAKYTILYAGVMSSGIAYTLQVLGQRHAEPTSAVLIMSLESVFAALSGWLILGEQLTPKELVGCIAVFTAVICVQVNPIEKKHT